MNGVDAKLTIFGILNEHYRNDFHLFWQRTQFFLLLEAGMLGFYLSKLIAPDAPRWARLTIVCTGILLCAVWWFVARSSIHWIEVWRREVVRIDSDVNPYCSFTHGEGVSAPGSSLYQRFRPEVVSSIMPLGFGLVWLMLAWMRLSTS